MGFAESRRDRVPRWRKLVLVLTPILLLPLPIALTSYKEARCGYAILLMAIFWVTEALPLEVTALVPLVAFPLLGILSTKQVCSTYMTDSVMLVLGSVIFAVALEQSSLSKRIALLILLCVGKSPRLVLAGVMAATVLLSMWMSNAAAAAIMVTTLNSILDEIYKKWSPPDHIVIPRITITSCSLKERTRKEASVVVGKANEAFEGDDKLSTVSWASSLRESEELNCDLQATDEEIQNMRLRKCLYLSVAFAASVGGTGTLTGTSSNMELMALLNKHLIEETELNFGSWMTFNIPGMIICTFAGWVWLQYLYLGASRDVRSPTKLMKERESTKVRKVLWAKYKALGPASFRQGTLIVLFALLLLLWLFRSPSSFPGWLSLFQHIFGSTIEITDTSSVMLVVILLFAIPCNIPPLWKTKSTSSAPYSPCLTWQHIQDKVPWGALLLVGSGFALAEAVSQSEFPSWLSLHLAQGISRVPLPFSIAVLTLVTVLVTNLMPDDAAANLLLPVCKKLSLLQCASPLYSMLPACVASSYAFLLPVGTPANAIVYYSSGSITTFDMMKAGVGLNVICLTVINFMINTLGIYIFPLEVVPSWANSTAMEYGC